MTTATMTAPPRITRLQPQRRPAASPRPAAAKRAEDPYQGFSKQDYEYLCKVAALHKAGKIKWFERELPEIPEN